MNNTFKTNNVLNVVKEAREVLNTIIDNKDSMSKMMMGAVFMTLLDSVKDVTAYVANPDNDASVVEEAMRQLDEAISRLEDDLDDMNMAEYDPSFNPNNKGSA